MQKINTAQIKLIEGQPHNTQFNDIYFSREEAQQESQYVFVEGCNLKKHIAQQKTLNLVETGFGTGLNFIQTWRYFEKYAKINQNLNYFSIEKHPLCPSDLNAILALFPCSQADALLKAYPTLYPGTHIVNFKQARITLTLFLGDIQTALPEIKGPIHCWYLDGFAPKNNPEMWSEELFNTMGSESLAGSTVSTFTASGAVRRALTRNGFNVTKQPGFGKKREMITATCLNPKRTPEKNPWFLLPIRQKNRKNIAIIGAGISGSSVANALAQCGHSCVVFEKNAIASGASGNAAGLIAPKFKKTYEHSHQFMLTAFYYSRQLALKHCTVIKPTGALYYPCKSFQPIKWMQSPIAHLLNQKGDRVFFPDAVTISPVHLVKSLMRHSNITLQTNQTITGFQAHEKGVILYHTYGETAFDGLVITNGADALSLLPEFAPWLFPMKGQLTAFKPRHQHTDEHAACFGHYCLPSLDNEVQWCGSSFIRGSTPTCTPEEDRSNLNAMKASLNLKVKPNATQSRSSVRLCSKDRLPIVGALPDFRQFKTLYPDLQRGKPGTTYPKAAYIPNVFLNIAHGAKGLTSAPLCSLLLTKIIQGETFFPYSWSELLHPARFWISSNKRKANQKCC